MRFFGLFQRRLTKVRFGDLSVDLLNKALSKIAPMSPAWMDGYLDAAWPIRKR